MIKFTYDQFVYSQILDNLCFNLIVKNWENILFFYMMYYDINFTLYIICEKYIEKIFHLNKSMIYILKYNILYFIFTTINIRGYNFIDLVSISVILYLNCKIHTYIYRQIIIFLTISYAIYSFNITLALYLIFFEFIKYSINNIVNLINFFEKNRDYAVETFFNNIYLSVIQRNFNLNSFLSMISNLYNYDSSNSFNDDFYKKLLIFIKNLEIYISGEKYLIKNDYNILYIKNNNFNIIQYESINEIQNTCPICLNETNINLKTICNHIFCYNCFIEFLFNSTICPLCRKNL